MNKFILTARLTSDPVFYGNQEESKCRANFRLAYNHNKDEVTFFTCTAWGKHAEQICKLKKGQRVLIEGEIKEAKWIDQQGGAQQDKQVNVRYMEYIDFPTETAQQPPVSYHQSHTTPSLNPPYGAPPPQQYYQPQQNYGAPPYQQTPPMPQQYVPPSNQPPQQYSTPPVQPAYPPQPHVPQGQGWNPNQPVSDQNLPF